MAIFPHVKPQLQSEILPWLSSEVNDHKGCVLWATVLLFIRNVHGVFSSRAIATDESIQVGTHRQFITRSTCKLDLVVGKRYLLMGKDGQTVDCHNK